MEEVAKVLNFTSDAALKFIKGGTEHHKMWTILESCFIAFTDELMLPYVRKLLMKNTPINGYWNFKRFMIQITFMQLKWF